MWLNLVEPHYNFNKFNFVMKKILVSGIFLIFTSLLNSQNNFEWDYQIYNSFFSEYEVGLKLPDSLLFFSSYQKNSRNHFEVFSEDGVLIKEKIYEVNGVEIHFLKGFWIGEKGQILLLGSAPPNIFAVLVLDKYLNIVFEKQIILTGQAKHPYQVDGIIYEPTNQVLLVAPSWDGILDDKEHSSIWFLKLQLDTYELQSELIKLKETGGWGACYAVVENIDTSGFTCFGRFIHYLDKNFNYIRNTFEPQSNITGGNQVKAIPWKENTYLVGTTAQLGGVLVQVMDKNLKIGLNFAADHLNRVAFPFNVFDLNDKGVLYTGAYDTPFLNQSNGFFIIQVDTVLRKNWEIYFGSNDQYRYAVSGILATKDGGALIYGRRYDDLGERVFNAYMVKFNADGNISWTNNIDASQLITIKIYPNPSNGPLILDMRGITGMAELRIFDTNGNNVYVHHDISEGRTTMDLSGLSNGTYMYKIYHGNKVIGKGRWVKVL